jgi:hypothetical protein
VFRQALRHLRQYSLRALPKTKCPCELAFHCLVLWLKI